MFQCPCIYDAVPKKRGPKTDVLEALLKRVDGLEAKLKEKNAGEHPSHTGPRASKAAGEDEGADVAEPACKKPALESRGQSDESEPRLLKSLEPCLRDYRAASVETDAFLDTYFSRFHGKPYYILDESSTRQRIQSNQLPPFLSYAIWAIASRHTPHPRGQEAAARLSDDYAERARRCINVDEPSTDCLQGLLLLSVAFIASGKDKKAYMLITSAVGMSIALELHREIDAQAQVSPVDREHRRRLFWTCYICDRFSACGSNRSPLINDHDISLRLPSWCFTSSPLAVNGEYFQPGSNLNFSPSSGKKAQGSTGILIDVTRILGKTNRYLVAGGVKGDSHFPWHSLSSLSKIRQELDLWASVAGPVFSDLHALFHRPEATIAFLSKLLYHLIHCLLYRPFLPIDLADLAGHGQHQSWQIEATKMCFWHANAIGELADAARQAGTVEWPAIVGFCISTAATVHLHGAHYTNPSTYGGDVSVFRASSDLLFLEIQLLSELHFSWATARHQSQTLQGICNAHGELVQAMAVSSSTRHSPVFHLEDFFDRYSSIGGPGGRSYRFDPAHLSMSDVVLNLTAARSGDASAAREAAALVPERQGHKRKSSCPYQSLPDARTSGQRGQPQQESLDQGLDREDVTYPAGGSSGQGIMSLSGTGFGGGLGYAPTPRSDPNSNSGSSSSSRNKSNGRSNASEAEAGYSSMFGTTATNAFSSPGSWQADDGDQQYTAQTSISCMPSSPGAKSKSGSAGTGAREEKDPFLSLLEQVAEDEQRFSGAGTDIDFFLGAGHSLFTGARSPRS